MAQILAFPTKTKREIEREERAARRRARREYWNQLRKNIIEKHIIEEGKE